MSTQRELHSSIMLCASEKRSSQRRTLVAKRKRKRKGERRKIVQLQDFLKMRISRHVFCFVCFFCGGGVGPPGCCCHSVESLHWTRLVVAFGSHCVARSTET